MSKKIRTEAVDYLFNAILSLENKEECILFFEDICTINELLFAFPSVLKWQGCSESKRHILR